MQRERVSDDVYVFISDLYVQVTAGLVMTKDGAILIDTLPFPEETLRIKRFVETRLRSQVRYVVNTHFHADHTTGTCFFPGAQVVGHARCHDLLDTRGRASLEEARLTSPELQDVEVILPDVVFESGMLNIHLGGKTLQLWHTPGHSPDSIVCLLKEEHILFGGDTVMPLPYFVDGSYDDFLASLQSLQGWNFEHIVPGHGEVILRGEIESKIQEDIDYLLNLQRKVDKALASSSPRKALNSLSVEKCGKSRILLNGVVEQLHRQNLTKMVSQRQA
ncbi:MAG: MBL fold metallo-hydrolase [Anaerolineaceae bacterium]|nr:MBL fold metallo-hydrolase [Anaerolineaceae bacterium]